MSIKIYLAAVAALMAMFLSSQPSYAWETSGSWGYPAVRECPDKENLCVVVSCPVKGKPSFELMLYEHGRGTGEEVLLQVDQELFPLALPEAGENSLYRWPLSNDVLNALRNGKTGGIVVDPGAEPRSFSLRGSGKAINGVLSKCAAGPIEGSLDASTGRSATTALTGLSDASDCAEGVSDGVVVSRELDRKKREIQTFQFKDRQYGEGLINVNLPETMPKARQKAIHAELLNLLKPGAKLRLKLFGCGAAGRVEYVSEIYPQ